MTEISTLQWIKTNLEPLMPISQAYQFDWLAGMVMRETGILIMRYAGKFPVNEVHLKMRGDYSKRKNDTDFFYHGYGYMQIDIDSYPDFVNSGDWKDPHKNFLKAIDVLEEKRKSLLNANPIFVTDRAIIASYNCGAGRVIQAIKTGRDVDTFTFNHDYSSEVQRFRQMYLSL